MLNHSLNVSRNSLKFIHTLNGFTWSWSFKAAPVLLGCGTILFTHNNQYERILWNAALKIHYTLKPRAKNAILFSPAKSLFLMK